MNSKPIPLLWTLRGEIDPADSENDNESVDYDFINKSFIFQWIRGQLRFSEPCGGKSTSLMPKMTMKIVYRHLEKDDDTLKFDDLAV